MGMSVVELLEDVLMRADVKGSLEVRIGDVAEGSDLHCSVGKLVIRGGALVLVPGDDAVWKDETVASDVQSVQVWPKLPVKVEK